jgi:hypothetical protein
MKSCLSSRWDFDSLNPRAFVIDSSVITSGSWTESWWVSCKG